MNRASAEILDDLFNEVDVVSTPDVAAATGLSEPTTRAYADDAGAVKVGNSYAWTRTNVADLLVAVEIDEDDEDDDEDDDDEDDDDEDDGDEDDGDEDDGDDEDGDDEDEEDDGDDEDEEDGDDDEDDDEA